MTYAEVFPHKADFEKFLTDTFTKLEPLFAQVRISGSGEFAVFKIADQTVSWRRIRQTGKDCMVRGCEPIEFDGSPAEILDYYLEPAR